jgi:hypothetical protein
VKKLIAILLIPAFLIATQGVAVTSLYCKGKLTKQGFNIKACCKDVNKGGCCDTKAEVVKVKDNYVSAAVSYDFHKFLDAATIDFRFSLLPEVATIQYLKFYWDNAPPRIQKGLYILFRSIII